MRHCKNNPCSLDLNCLYSFRWRPISGSNFVDILKLCKRDPQIEASVLISKIGRNAEETAANYIKEHVIIG